MCLASLGPLSGSWDDANKKYEEITEANKSGMALQTIPYKIGISAAVIGGFASFPLCFDFQTVHWFNEHYVTTDIPPKEVSEWSDRAFVTTKLNLTELKRN
tara:strand:+ start:359 stop:661 length:303 start_codon:yes stop_codon:yes gene_type:complete